MAKYDLLRKAIFEEQKEKSERNNESPISRQALAEREEKAREREAEKRAAVEKAIADVGIVPAAPRYERQYNMPEIAADNVAPYLREVTIAQKEYDDYVNSQEFQQRKREAAEKLTRNTPMSEVPRNAPQMTEVFEDETSKGLKAKADYYKKLSNDEKTRRIMAQDMAEINAMPEEDRKLFERYAGDNTEQISTLTPLDLAHAMEETEAELIKKYGAERLAELKESYSWYTAEQEAEQAVQSAHDMNDTGVGAVAQNIVGLPLRALGGLGALGGRAFELIDRTGRYPTLAPYTGGDIMSVYGNAITADTAERIAGDGDSKVRKGLSVGYQAVTSAADSAVRLALAAATGGTSGSLALAGINSFTDTLREASRRGAPPAQAYLMATANGVLEVMTEKVSLDKALEKAKQLGGSDLRKWVLNTLGQAGVEASEEEASYFGSLLAEAAILQGNSEYNQTIGELVANGMSYEEAKAQANKNVWNEAVNTAVVSGLSGAIMGAGTTAYSDVMTKLGKQGAQASLQEAAGNQQSGILPEASMDTTKAQSPDAEVAGTPQAGNALTNALDKLAETGNVSNKTVEKILADPAAMEQLSRQTGLDLSQMATASEKRNAVKAAVRQMAGDTAPTTLNREGAQSLIEDMGQELAERAPARQETPEVTPERQAVQNAFDRVLGVDTGTDLGTNRVDTQTQPEYTGKRSQQVQSAIDRLNSGGTDAPGIDEIMSIPEIAAAERANDGPETITLPNRQAIQDEAYRQAIQKGSWDGQDYNGEVRHDKRMDIVIGLPGSGKSSVYTERLSQEYKSRVIDTDDFRGYIPEYNGSNASMVHREASRIRNRLLNSALDNGDNILLSTIGADAQKLAAQIQKYKDEGYSVYLHLNELPNNKSLARAVGRYISEDGSLGRYVSTRLIAEYGDKPTQTYLYLTGQGGIDNGGLESNLRQSGGRITGNAESTGGAPQSQTAGREAGLLAGYDWYNNDVERGQAPRLIQSSEQNQSSPQVADSSGKSTGGGQTDASAKSSVGAADRDFTGFEAYDNLLSDDNVQPRRASDAKNVEVPKTDAYGRNVSEFAHNAMNSDIISQRDIDTAKRLVQEGAFGHDTQKMADVRDRVYDEIQEKGVSASVREVSIAAAGGKISEYDIAKAQALFAMLTDKKGVRAENMAGELLVDLGEMATQSGRQLNMFKLLRKLTPEGQISAVKSNINRYVDTLNEHRSAKKQVNVEIPAELEQDYVKAVRSGNEATQKQALDQIYKYAAAQIPATLEEKFNSLRHMSMLGAPLTHIRNFGATGAFRPLSDIKRTISAGIQALTLDQKNRTAAVIGLGKESRELLSWAKNDAESDMAVSMMKGTYQNGDNARSEIENKRTIFKTKALEGARKFTSNTLEAEDMVWKKREYALTLASFLKARGYTVDQVTGGAVPSKVMAEGRELAVKEALKSTFNDRNKFSDTISKFRKKGSDPWSKSLNIMAQGILPYTRTPANLGARAFEYGPAGLAKAAYDLTEGVKSGKITAAQGIDNLASGLTGTGMMFLGGALAAGIIPGVRLVGAKPDDDEDEENTQEYALEIGDLSIGISWLAPVNIPLFVGANLYNKIKAAGDDGDIDPWDIIAAIVDSAASSLDPVLELSCMSGLNDAIDNMKYEDTAGDKFVAMAYSAATGYFLQAIPTLFGRIEKGVEPNKKRTFSNGETTVQRSVERTLGGAFQKLPGDPFQIDKVDAYGNVVKDSGNPVTRLANALLNPFNVQKIDRSELTQEIKRLSGVQPDKVNMPSAPKTVSYTDADGNHHDNERLTAEQYSTLEKTQKQTAAKLLGQVIGTDIYKAMTDDQKADVFSYVYNYAREKGRAEAIDGYPGLSDSWMQDVDKNGYGTIVEKVVTKSFSNAFTSMDTSALENAYGLYSAMDKDRQKQFRENNGGRVGYYITAKEKGVSDGVFTDLYGTYKKLDGDKSMTVNQKAQEWSKTLSEAYEDGRISKAGHDALKEEMAFRQTYTAKTEKFDAMTESGLSSDVADRIIKGLADLQGTGSVDKDTGKATVTNRDKWGYIAALDDLSDKEKDRLMLLYMPDYNPDSGKPDKTELKYAYMRSKGYSAEQFTQTYGVTKEFTTKADMIAAWVALGYSNEEAQMFYKLYKGKLV